MSPFYTWKTIILQIFKFPSNLRIFCSLLLSTASAQDLIYIQRFNTKIYALLNLKIILMSPFEKITFSAFASHELSSDEETFFFQTTYFCTSLYPDGCYWCLPWWKRFRKLHQSGKRDKSSSVYNFKIFLQHTQLNDKLIQKMIKLCSGIYREEKSDKFVSQLQQNFVRNGVKYFYWNIAFLNSGASLGTMPIFDSLYFWSY